MNTAAATTQAPHFQNEFFVNDESVTSVKFRIAEAAKKAARFGCPAPVAVWGTPIRHKTRNEITGREQIIVQHPLTLTLETSLSFQGWTLMARIEHDKTIGTLVHCVPGVELPKSFREATPICNHCNAKRIRRDTFVLSHEDGRVVQIGRQCIRDFLGHNPWSLVPFFKALGELSDDLEEDMRSGRFTPVYSAFEIGRVAIYLIRKGGFRPSSFDGKTTKGDVRTVFEPSMGIGESAALERKFSEDTLAAITEEDEQMTRDAIARWAALEITAKTSEFEVNVSKIFAADVVAMKHLGLAVAGFNSHLKALGIEAERKRASKVASQYVGTVGERLRDIKVVCIRCIYIDTDFGPLYIHSFLDEAGNVLVWKTGSHKLEQGTPYVLTGTVKKQEEYIGRIRETGAALPPVKQTTLSRCIVKE